MARVIKADPRGPRLHPAVVFSAEEQARAVLDAARAEAEAVRARAREEGRVEGRAELAAACLRLAGERERWLAEAHAQAIEVALRLAGHLVGEALETRPDRIAQVVEPLLERVRHAGRIGIRAHPDDHPALAAACGALVGEDGLPRAITLTPDATISRGGCVVETDAGVLDARLEVRIDALRQALARP